MSFVISPEWVQAAAQDLEGLRSALLEASDSTAAVTTKIAPAAADEISAAVAAMFGGWGDEFQVISAQTQAFHADFVRTLNSSVGAYLNAESAIVGQLLAGGAPGAAAALPAASILDGLLAPGGLLGGSGGLLGGVGAFGPGGLLGGLGLPSLNALLPGVVGPAPGPTPVSLEAITGPYNRLVINTFNNLQNLGTALAANPTPILRQFIANQLSYGGIVSAAFSSGDLASIATIPARIGQNVVNVLSTLTDLSFSVGTNINPFAPVNPVTHLLQSVGTLQLGAAFFGLPIALGIDLIGTPLSTGAAVLSVGSAFFSAMQSGDGFGALVAALTAPAVVADGFLNGHISLALGLPGVTLPLVGGLGGITVPLTAQLPLGGLLTPLSTTTLVVNNPLASQQALLSVPLGGTPTGGLVPGLSVYAPQQLAVAIGAQPAYQSLIPVPVITLPVIGTLPSLAGVVAGLNGLRDGLGGLTGGLSGVGGLLGGLVPGLNGGVPGVLGGLLGGGTSTGGGLLGGGLLGGGTSTGGGLGGGLLGAIL
jgi:PE family